MRLVLAALVLLLAGCSSSPGSSSAPPDSPSSARARSWIAMEPEDALTFEGPGGELLLIYVDETYAIDGTNASALTWELGGHYTTDYFVQDDAGTLWWYGRKGEWRAGRHGAQPREVDLAGHRARFGDITITLSEAREPVQVRMPDGVYTR